MNGKMASLSIVRDMTECGRHIPHVEDLVEISPLLLFWHPYFPIEAGHRSVSTRLICASQISLVRRTQQPSLNLFRTLPTQPLRSSTEPQQTLKTATPLLSLAVPPTQPSRESSRLPRFNKNERAIEDEMTVSLQKPREAPELRKHNSRTSNEARALKGSRSTSAATGSLGAAQSIHAHLERHVRMMRARTARLQKAIVLRQLKTLRHRLRLQPHHPVHLRSLPSLVPK